MNSKDTSNPSKQDISASAQPTIPSVKDATVVMATDGGKPLPGSPVNEEVKHISLPGFEILSCLGVGGMGSVFLARQTSLNRYVAVKMIKSEFAKLPRYRDRLVSEARTMAALNHPNVVACYDIITTSDHIFIIMEYIPGRLTVKDLFLRFGCLTEEDVVKILTDVVEGLAYVNQKGYIHQDLKPDNLMVCRETNGPTNTPSAILNTPGNRIVIGDFGISRSIRKSDGEKSNEQDNRTIVGSPVYMPPEQYFTPETIDFRADIYALASTAYLLLTGMLPFSIEDKEELMQYKRTHGVPNPCERADNISGELGHIIMHMGRPRPEERYLSYDDLLNDLHRLQTMKNIWFRVADREATKRAFRHGALLSAAIALIFILPFIIRKYVWKPYFTPTQISMAQSLAFWEDDDLKGWTRMPPDIEEPHVYLRGMNTTEPLVLKRQLAPGDIISFQVRLHGTSQMVFGLRNDDGPCLQVAWRRGEGRKMDFMLSTEKRPFSFIGEFSGKPANKWMPFQIQFEKTQAIILSDNKILSVAHFKEPLERCKFFVSLGRNRYIELKDVYIEESPKTKSN